MYEAGKKERIKTVGEGVIFAPFLVFTAKKRKKLVVLRKNIQNPT
jgi:hypothetical protein